MEAHPGSPARFLEVDEGRDIQGVREKDFQEDMREDLTQNLKQGLQHRVKKEGLEGMKRGCPGDS